MNHNENLIAWIFGCIGGMFTMILQVVNNVNPVFLEQLIKTFAIGFVSGAAGIAGKYAFNKVKDWWHLRKQKKINLKK